MPTYAVTGATGQLGRRVIRELVKRVSPNDVVAAVRSPDKARDLAALGVEVREADYDRPETLDRAFSGVRKVLLISANEIGHRARQHAAVIDAAKRAEVEFIVYTSILHAGTSTLALAEEHRRTEADLEAAGIPYALLRNGWYTENHLAGAAAAIEHGVLLGAAADGRISSAARADYAEAAAIVLSDADSSTRIYELAGDDGWTLSELAAELSRVADRSIAYQHMPERDYAAVLTSIGLPPPLADALADADARAASGGLYDDGRELSRLIGRPTAPMAQSVEQAVRT